MTKMLPKVMHDYLVGHLMMGVRDGVVETWLGEKLPDWRSRRPEQMELYLTDPPGLSVDDLLLPDVKLKGGEKILGTMLSAEGGKGIVLETKTREKIGKKKQVVVKQHELAFEQIDQTKIIISF